MRSGFLFNIWTIKVKLVYTWVTLFTKHKHKNCLQNTNNKIFVRKNLKIKYYTIIIISHGCDRQSRRLIVFSQIFEYGFRCASHGSRLTWSQRHYFFQNSSANIYTVGVQVEIMEIRPEFEPKPHFLTTLFSFLPYPDRNQVVSANLNVDKTHSLAGSIKK